MNGFKHFCNVLSIGNNIYSNFFILTFFPPAFYIPKGTTCQCPFHLVRYSSQSPLHT